MGKARWRVLLIGKPKLTYCRLGIDEFSDRLRPLGGYEVITLKAGQREDESRRLLEKSEGTIRVVLDERGNNFTTRQLSRKLEDLEGEGIVSFLIGGADGHTEDLRHRAGLLLQLSSLTLQHELAAVVLLEQLYRVASLRAGHPYHRD